MRVIETVKTKTIRQCRLSKFCARFTDDMVALFAAGSALAFGLTEAHVTTNGAWILWATHPTVVTRMKIAPARDRVFVSYVSGAATFVYSNTSPTPTARQLLPGCDGITNRAGFDVLGLEVTKVGNPIVFTSYNPANPNRLYTFDPNLGRFVHPLLPQSDEASWNQAAGGWGDQSRRTCPSWAS